MKRKWFCLFVGIVCVDALITAVGITIGVFYEKNPFLNYCLGIGGLPSLVAVKLGITALCVGMLEYWSFALSRVGTHFQTDRVYLICAIVYGALIASSLISDLFFA